MAQVNCLVLTYNCGREAVKPDIFAKHISDALREGPDHEIIVLSLQEAFPMPYGFIGGRCLSFYYKKINQAIRIATGLKPANSLDRFTNVFTKNLGITAMMVYIRQNRKDCIGSIESASTGVGWHETGNKGAVGIKLAWLASPGKYVDLTFIAAHLAPHEPGVGRRNQDWMHIVQRLIFEPVWVSNKRIQTLQAAEDTASVSGTSTAQTISDESEPLLKKDSSAVKASKDTTEAYSTIYSPRSYTFIAGDLNYRTANKSPHPEDYAQYPKTTESWTSIKKLLSRDQLSSEAKADRTLQGFQEADITFPPTYKYSDRKQKEVGIHEDAGTLEEYIRNSSTLLGYAVHRWPSWCDRILYMSPSVEGKTPIQNNFYKSLPLMSTSDHQPVVASFLVSLEQSSSGLANRGEHQKNNVDWTPYVVDQAWKERFAAARRLELAIGVAAYLGMTWEGNSILLATFMGAVGGYVILRGGIL